MKARLLILVLAVSYSYSVEQDIARIFEQHPVIQPACGPVLRPRKSCANCTLSDWAERIFSLKERPVEFSSLPAQPSYEGAILTRQEFLRTLQACAAVLKKSCAQDNQWLSGVSLVTLYPELYNLTRAYKSPPKYASNFMFKPYAQRLHVSPGTQILMFGDMHGSIHSLIRDLLKLKADGYIDDNFKLIKPNTYILFLGDYVDRGIYGAEVLYTVARLKVANPEHMFFTRGNHEDYNLEPAFKVGHNKQEEKDTAPSFIDELYYKFKFTERDEVTVFRLYDLFPAVIYVTCGTPEHIDAVQCCHGGIELGYNPQQLLQSDPHVRFELVGTLLRRSNFTHKLPIDLQKSIKAEFDLDSLCDDLRDFTPRAAFYTTGHGDHTQYFGFMWSDFYVDPKTVVGQRSKKYGGWVYGKRLTQHILRWGDSARVTLRGLIRAHQHNNETGGPMLNRLCCGRGITDVWNNSCVHTILSAPSSKLDDTGENCFTYDAFIMLITAAGYKNWRIVQYIQDTALEQKSWKRLLLKRYSPEALSAH